MKIKEYGLRIIPIAIFFFAIMFLNSILPDGNGKTTALFCAILVFAFLDLRWNNFVTKLLNSKKGD